MALTWGLYALLAAGMTFPWTSVWLMLLPVIATLLGFGLRGSALRPADPLSASHQRWVVHTGLVFVALFAATVALLVAMGFALQANGEALDIIEKFNAGDKAQAWALWDRPDMQFWLLGLGCVGALAWIWPTARLLRGLANLARGLPAEASRRLGAAILAFLILLPIALFFLR